MTTAAEFLTFVKRAFKRTDKDTELLEATNNVIREIRRRHPFNELYVESYTTGITTLGQYVLDVPSNFGTIVGDLILQKTDTDYYPLQQLPKDEFDRLYPNPTSTNVSKNQPQHYCMFGTKIIIGPVPDSVSYLYTLSYSTKLSTDLTSTSTMPFDDFLEGIKRGVLRNIYADMGDDGEATKWATLFEKDFAEYVAQDRENTRSPRRADYHGI